MINLSSQYVLIDIFFFNKKEKFELVQFINQKKLPKNLT